MSMMDNAGPSTEHHGGDLACMLMTPRVNVAQEGYPYVLISTALY